jgi:hypothetical protein
MIPRMMQDATSVPPALVWAGLSLECQARVIQSLARLASHLVTQESIPTPRRSADDDPSLGLEDPA